MVENKEPARIAARIAGRTSSTTTHGGARMADFTPRPILSYLKRDPDIAARFRAKVDQRGAADCWPWRASTDGRGYGRMKVASHETRIAPRLAWTIHNDREPGMMVVRHSCDNPICCNPAHLLLGSHQDNANDKVERGRCRTGRQDGENNGHAILSIEQVGKIVDAFRDGFNNQQIAARFPVSDSLISRIRTGRSWRKQSASFGWEPQRLVAPPPARINREAAHG